MPFNYYSLTFIINTAASFYMLGVIWQIQILQYPAFQLIDARSFAKHHAFHTRRISYVVILPMLLELGSSFLLLFMNFEPHNTINIIGFLLVISIWTSTFFIQVPLHEKLKNSEGDLSENIKRLITTNWLRTLLWSLKAGLAVLALMFLFE